MNKRYYFMMCLMLLFTMGTRAQTSKIPFQLDGAVAVSANKGDTVFIGGAFTKAFFPDSSARYGTPVDLADGKPVMSWPMPNGLVNTAISDGYGGFYIGGNFTMVGSEPRKNIAHISNAGIVTPQLSGTFIDGEVKALAFKNDVLYAGGLFSTAGDANVPAMNNNSAFTFNHTTGVINPSLPVLNGGVYASASDGAGGFFAAGLFSTANGQVQRIVHIDASGNLMAWNPNVSGVMYSLAFDGTRLYIAGNGLFVDNIARGSFIALDATTGALLPFNFKTRPSNHSVYTVTIDNNHLYLGGMFDSICGKKRNGLACIPIGYDTVTNWDPNPTGTASMVWEITVHNNLAYIGGTFSAIGGQTRNRLAAIDITTGVATGWNPNPGADFNWPVNAIAISGNNVYIGGAFTQLGGEPRNYIGAVDINTGLATVWEPIMTGMSSPNNINAIEVINGVVYAGGAFTSLNGASNVIGIAAIDTLTGSSLPGKAPAAVGASGRTISSFGSTVFVGLVSPTNVIVGGQSRSKFAAINVVSNSILPVNLNISINTGTAQVTTLAVLDTALYIGGAFTSIGGQARTHFAVMSTLTDSIGAFNASMSGAITSMVISGDTVFVGGGFTTFGGQTRNRIAVFSHTTQSVLPWNIGLSTGSVSALAVSGNILYVAGTFNGTIGGQARVNLAALDRTSGLATSWNPAAPTSTYINSLAVSDDNILYVGGSFSNLSVGGQTRTRLMSLDGSINTNMTTSWTPDVIDGIVYTVAFSGSNFYAGGSFTKLGGNVIRNRAAAFSAASGKIFDWNPNITATGNGVQGMLLSDDQNTVYLSGSSLTAVGGITTGKLVAVNAVTGFVDPTWNPNPNNLVKCMTISNGSMYMSGSFTMVGDSSRSRVAIIDMATGRATAWKCTLNNSVNAMVLKGNTLYVAGAFTIAGDSSRNRIASIDVTTGRTTAWNPNASTAVNSMVQGRSNTLFVGGNFVTIGDSSRNRFAELDMTTGKATAWNPVSDGNVAALINMPNGVYAGGSFAVMGGTARNRLAAIDGPTAAPVSSWNPLGLPTTSGATVNTITLASNMVYAGSSAAPYIMGFSESSALPVTFTTVKAVKQGDDVKVLWSTASEVNNAYFEVERSFDGKSFETIGTPVKGAGNSSTVRNYSYTDYNAFASGAAAVYYRIKQVDFDNRFDHSKVVSVNGNKKQEALSEVIVYPNPFSDQFTISLHVNTMNTSTISVTDITGKTIINVIRQLKSGNNSVVIEEANKLHTGIYFLTVQSGNEKQVMKVIKY